jgi:hypothetical protein
MLRVKSSLPHVLQSRDDLAVERVPDALAGGADGAEDGQRDECRHQPVFDCRDAILIVGEPAKTGEKPSLWALAHPEFHVVR